MRDTIEISDEAFSAPYRAAGTMFILSAFALGQAIYVNNGLWHPIAMAWLSVAMLALIYGLRSPGSTQAANIFRISPRRLIGLFLAVQWGQLLMWGIGIRRSYSEPIWVFVGGMLIAGVGVVLIVLRLAASRIGGRETVDLLNRKRSGSAIFGFALIVAGHFLAGCYVIRGMNLPRIDVWNFQQDSTAALLRGQSPYTVRYRNIYEPANDYGPGTCVDGWMTFSFPYPPLTLLADIPGRLLGDVRWSGLILLEIAALLIALAWSDHNGVLAAAMLLLSPCSLFVIYSAWTEPIVIATFAFVLYCVRRKENWLWLAVGLFVASKQYAVFAMPAVLLMTPESVRRRGYMGFILKSAAVAGAITLPFVLWTPAPFFQSTVMMLIHAPLRMDGLTFSALIARTSGLQIPSWIGLLALGGASIWAWRRLPRNGFTGTGAAGLIFVLFFAFTKQAFCNYYFLVIGVMCGAIAMMLPDEEMKQSQSESGESVRIEKRLAA